MSIVSIAKNIANYVKQQLVYRNHFKTIAEMRGKSTFTKLTKEQEDEVQDFYLKHFGKKISLKWHEYYYKVNGEFSPRYIPTYIYYAHIASKLNDSRIAVVYSDKNMIEKLLGDKVKFPKTYAKNMNGIYYINDEVVSKESAIKACMNIADGIIKHSIDTSKGMSILRFGSKDGFVKGKNCPKTIVEMFDSYKKNFIVQDAIHQTEKLASLNPTSLNTVRILTYWSKNGVVPVFAVIRMGRKGSVVDNASAGGMYCGINIENGSLKKNAYTLTPFSSHTHSDNGIEFESYVVPRFEDLKAKAIELHQQLPYVKLVGWDLTIDENNDIVIIEANANCPGLFQAATGPAFGEYTEEILEICRT